MVGDHELYQTSKRAAELDATVLVHAENGNMIDFYVAYAFCVVVSLLTITFPIIINPATHWIIPDPLTKVFFNVSFTQPRWLLNKMT